MKIKITLPIGILAIIITACFVGCKGSKDTSVNPSIGTLLNPFLVNSPESLLKVGTGKDGWGLDKHYKQTADIDMAGQKWTAIGEYKIIRTPIGKYEDIRFADFDEKIIEKPFTGSFDGNGYTIIGLTTEGLDDVQGLFGYIGKGGEVKNIAMINNSISGDEYVGGLVGMNYGTVQNCYTTGNITGQRYVGGLVGMNSGTVYSTGDVTGRHMFAGGLVGSNSGTVQNCYTTGNIGEERFVGGVVGDNDHGTVQNCYATGRISGTSSDAVGGVVGDSNEGYRVHGCVGLNPSITRIGGYTDHSVNQFGRVMGDNYQCYTYNNYGRRGMRLPAAPISEPVKSDADGVHGADITSAQWNKASWWEKTAEFSSEAWNFRNGLPTLKGVGGKQNPVVR